jgi:outer membrane protein assembly factor BamB
MLLRNIALSQSLVVVLVTTAAVFADDWPHPRGRRFDGVQTEKVPLAESWPLEGPPVRWRVSLGQGYSGVIVAAGKVFTQFQDRTSQYVAAFDAVTGAELWRTHVDWPWQASGAYPGPYATPTFAEGRVFYTTPMGTLGCLNAATGARLWSVDFQQRFRGEGTEFGYAASPTVVKDRIYLPVGGKGSSVVAFAAQDGAVVWQQGDAAASYATIYPVTCDGREVLLALMRNHLVLHDATTGEVLWREQISASYDEHAAWPLFGGNRVTIASPFKAGMRQFQLRSDGVQLSGKEVWFRSEFSNDVCSSVLYQGDIFGFAIAQAQASAHRTSRGKFLCVAAETGEMRWQTDRVGHASVVVADEKLVILEDTGTLVLARANGDAYEELARGRILSDQIGWAAPVVVDGVLYARQPAEMVCVDLRRDRESQPTLPPQRLAVGRRWQFSPTHIVPYEPEFPHDEPQLAAVVSWYFACLWGVVLPAGVIAGGVFLWGRWRKMFDAVALGERMFWLAVILGGIVGTTWLGYWQQTYLLTWPATLYAAFRVLLGTTLHADRATTTPESWLPRGGAGAFVLLAWGYYQLCYFTGYVMAWAFLAGFLPAAPFAVAAASARNAWWRWPCEWAAFTAFFFAGGLLPLVKASWSGGWA